MYAKPDYHKICYVYGADCLCQNLAFAVQKNDFLELTAYYPRKESLFSIIEYHHIHCTSRRCIYLKSLSQITRYKSENQRKTMKYWCAIAWYY